jgi:CheY-like chemotaxis protein
MSPLNGKPLVFVVDDEPIIASTLTMILSLYGLSAQSFTQPLLALQAARSNAPDLLISDVVMPQLSGIELAIQVKEQCPDCKVLLLSGQVHNIEHARALGWDFEFLTKPVHPLALLKRIQSLIEVTPAIGPGGELRLGA